MTYNDVLAALHARLGRPVHAHIEGPGPAVLARFEGKLTAGHDLTRRNDPDDPDAGVFVMFDNTVNGFLIDPHAFVAAQELYDGRLLRIEQVGAVAFMIELRD